MKQLKPQTRWLILAEAALTLAPGLVLVFAGPLGIGQRQALFVFATSLVSCLTCMVSLYITGRQMKDKASAAARILYVFIPAVQYVVIFIQLAAMDQPQIRLAALMPIGMGLMFILIGNVLPKAEPNPAVGVRTRWSLENRENWVLSNRISGYLWVAGGFACWLGVIFRLPFWAQFFLIMVVAFSPLPVSSIIHRRQVKEGTWCQDMDSRASGQGLGRTGVILLVMFLVVSVGLSLFVIIAGRNYEISVQSGRLEIRSPLTASADVSLEDVESLVLKEAGDPGWRTMGYSAAGIDLGDYRNDEYGDYLRFTGPSPVAIELKAQNRTIVFSLDTEAKTRQLYQQLVGELQDLGSAAVTEAETG